MPDWSSSENRKQFLASAEFARIYTQWQSCPVPFQSSSPLLFHLTPSTDSRKNAFALPNLYTHPLNICVSVFVAFRFSPSFDLSKIHVQNMRMPYGPPQTKKEAWDTAWDVFAHDAMKSDGGIASNGNIRGWGVDEKSFLAVFRFLN